MIGYYLTHPQVAIDPRIPVPEWSLSDSGRQRVADCLAKPWIAKLGRIVSSAERKAIEGAEIIAHRLGLGFEIKDGMGENDRSATGFLPPDRFEAAADAFFASPDESFRGWERAVDAQARIVKATDEVLGNHDGGAPILFVGHGGVGTLLKCHLGGVPISRLHDQPAGGGNVYAFGLADRKLLCDWTPLERFEGVSA